jgi:hypothetical protein
VYLVFTNPVSEEREDEYNEYYSDVHAPEVVQSHGFVSARRFRLSDAQQPAGVLAQYKYVTIYELDSDDLPATFEQHAARRQAGSLTHSDSIAPGSSYAVFELLE